MLCFCCEVELYCVHVFEESIYLTVWLQGRVEFAVRGPRLNLTKEHKTGVVYGPDHRLHWRVTTPMPRALVSQPLQLVQLNSFLWCMRDVFNDLSMILYICVSTGTVTSVP